MAGKFARDLEREAASLTKRFAGCIVRSLHTFSGPYPTANVKNVMKCRVEFLVPDGRMIPSCAYNSVGYRDQVARELMTSVIDDRRWRER
jgi:uncharacterized radical SAM superfamily Fe-S cluster-containing enzyme